MRFVGKAKILPNAYNKTTGAPWFNLDPRASNEKMAAF
jgi:hypothetical protein